MDPGNCHTAARNSLRRRLTEEASYSRAVLEGRLVHEVLGPGLENLRESMGANHRPAWGEVPPAGALVLWLRNNLPGTADQILARARVYYTRAS